MSDPDHAAPTCRAAATSGILRLRAARLRREPGMNHTARFDFFYFYGYFRLAERVERRA
jgi:hypothetical protein